MLVTEAGFAAGMAAGAALALAAVMLRQKLKDWREARLRGDWDAY